LLVVAVAAVTVAFTALAIRGAHPGDVADAIRDSNPLWLIPALLVLGIGVWLRALRWQVLFPPESRPGLWPVTASTLIGYFFTQILPLRAGEVARVVALNQRSGTSRAEIAGTVVIERVYDLIALLGLLFVLVPWLPEVTWLRAAAGFAAAVLLVVLLAAAALVHWGDRAVHAALRPFGRLPFVPSAQLEEIGTNLARGLAGLRHGRLAAWAFVLTVVSWVVLGLSGWLVFVAFDLGLSPAAGIFTLIALGLSAVLPAGPSGIRGRRARGVRRRRLDGALRRARPPRAQLRPVRDRGARRPALPRPHSRSAHCRIGGHRPRKLGTHARGQDRRSRRPGVP
jgi:uncharacterized membrane protein YbhN (UPF0104 family)